MERTQSQEVVVEFDTMEQLDTLVAPFRLRLLSCFREPATVKEAADKLGVQVTRLYRHGFLHIVEERPTAKTVEKVYQTAGKNIRPSALFIEQYGTDGNAELLRLGFRAVEADVVAAALIDPTIDTSGDQSVVGFTRLFLDEANLKELVEEIDHLFRRFNEGEQTGNIEVSFMASVVPLRRPEEEGASK